MVNQRETMSTDPWSMRRQATLMSSKVALVLLLVLLQYGGSASAQTDSSCLCDSAVNRAALRAFYAATFGPTSWKRKWIGIENATATLCLWGAGLTCDASGMLSIQLDDNGLSGTLPVELADVQRLRAVSLASNSLSSGLPPQFSAWGSTIRSFAVPNNKLSGSLPSSYSNWSSIEVFSVFSNSLSGELPSPIWPMIRSVNLAGNVFTGTIPSEYALWTALTSIRLSKNLLSGTLPASLSGWGSTLTMFLCDGNQFSGTVPSSVINAWINLETADMSNNQFRGTLPTSENSGGFLWPMLTYFKVSTNAFEGTLPSVYASWVNLTYFDVGHNRLTGVLPEEYSRWSLLQQFGATNNTFSGVIPSSYQNWTLLQTFDVAFNSLAGTLPSLDSEIGGGRGSNRPRVLWPSLTSFRVFSNQLTGTLHEEYSAWTALTYFRVSGNVGLHGTLPAGYSAWGSSLTAFACDGCQISGSIPNSYVNWTNLETIDIADNQLTGSLPEVKPAGSATWPKLEYFRAFSNKLSGTLPAGYGASTTLNYFRVENNTITGTIPWQYSRWGSSLQLFMCQSNSLSGTLPSQLSAWSLVNYFRVQDNHLTGTLPESYSLWGSSILLFSVANNSLTGTISPGYANNWTNLITFDASFNRLEGLLPSPTTADAMSSFWPNLEAFRMQSNRFTGTLSPLYAQWAVLQVFYVHDNFLTGTLSPAFGLAWTSLTLFRASNNSISGTLPTEFSRWTMLQYFRADLNSLTGTIPESYASFSRLSTFILSRNQLTGTLPKSFGASWPLIAILHLYANRLTGSIPSEWGLMTKMAAMFLHTNNLTGELPSSLSQMPLLVYLSVSWNPLLSGTIPASWGAAFSGRTSGLILGAVWLQNTSISGTIPATWQSSMFTPMASTLTVCHTHLCGPAPPLLSLGLPFGMGVCMPDSLSREEPSANAVSKFASVVSLEALDTTFAGTCPSNATTHSPPPPPPSTPFEPTNTSVSPQPQRPSMTASSRPPATVVTAPIGAAVAASFGAAPSALGMYRSNGMMRLLNCNRGVPTTTRSTTRNGTTSQLDNNSTDEGEGQEDVDEVYRLAMGHILAFAGCVVIVAFAVTWAVLNNKSVVPSSAQSAATAFDASRSITSVWILLKVAMVQLHLPGRFSVVVFSLGPPLSEHGLTLLLLGVNRLWEQQLGTSGAVVALGAASFVVGAATLLAACYTVTFGFQCEFVPIGGNCMDDNEAHISNVCVKGWRRIKNRYETPRRGFWRPQNNGNSNNNTFLDTHGDLFATFTGRRQWYVVVQCVLAVTIGIIAALSESGVVEGPAQCGAAQIAGGVCMLLCLVALLVLRPYQSATHMALDTITELFGFISGVMMLLVAAVTSDDEDGGSDLIDAASSILEVQLWFTVSVIAIEALHELYSRWLNREGRHDDSNPSLSRAASGHGKNGQQRSNNFAINLQLPHQGHENSFQTDADVRRIENHLRQLVEDACRQQRRRLRAARYAAKSLKIAA
ncbi:GP46-like surface antigen, putative [Bodo saltans]|uniref:GP46-like surface antigen, putative n=1 Tax=Bodo saltans TaxID=75058 RepID=A0A0S4J4C3_BODSA|nr:GP46-like surface antigen, putative [Bodo saltans]|eukprot:CUG78525.1 GP46-like surface antigen, putative [Bodo saltans]